jgi:hypothetical protein
MEVFVTNCSDTHLTDRHNGVDYQFKKGVPTPVSIETARHIFGYQDDDKLPYAVRLGFATHSSDLEIGLERLAMFRIGQHLAQDRIPSAVGVVPLPVKKVGVGGKVS